ncbi:hypothetical protein [Teredinibacter haidensis]|uniref:hypothetical protein n=1 Tax=Teredinibacter haidensis TaxID=2731755 RepID=UPI00094916F9|nr:hypothetical protein [Teredinibacter haidensis]
MSSLLVVSAVNQRQTRTRVISRKLGQMKRRADELEELAVTVDRLVNSPEIARHINDEVIDLITTMIQLDPTSQTLPVLRYNAEQLAEEMRNPARHREIYRLQESDANIARTLYQLTDTGRILRRRQAAGKLEVAQMEAFIGDLSWTHLMVGVVSHTIQGHKSMARGDVLRAYAFYKKAQQVALQSSTNDDRRHALIRELSELMSGQRKFLSPVLMPETEFNPPAETDTAKMKAEALDQSAI